MKFENNKYYIVSFNDEEVKFEEFPALDEVREYVKEMFDENNVENFSDEDFKDFFEESYVDGDSSSCRGLYQFVDSSLKPVYNDFIEFCKFKK